MIGRKKEIEILQNACKREEAQLVAVYGRRRIGKTYLVRETLGKDFSFYHTGVARSGFQEQLAAFRDSLIRWGLKDCPLLKSWREAFNQLAILIENSDCSRRVVFIDELPYMDTPRSNFVSAFEHFWNGWASARKGLVMVICGSAASWIVRKVFRDHGGLHNRVTERIHLMPFTLGECAELAYANGLSLTRQDICELYMVFGGVPFYWSLMPSGLSAPQIIDNLVFSEGARLRYEYREVFDSLFRNSESYRQVVTALSKAGCGLSREEIFHSAGLSDCGTLSHCLEDLEACGFIRRYSLMGRKKRGAIYQLLDNFSLFHLKFLESESNTDPEFWTHAYSSPALNAWRGFAFERICLQHIAQIKTALGISGVLTKVYSWRHVPDKVYPDGAQIDLLIERADRVVNVCEIKYSREPFVINKEYNQKLRTRIGTFVGVTKTRLAPHLTMITAGGLAHTGYWGTVQREVSLDDLFV